MTLIGIRRMIHKTVSGERKTETHTERQVFEPPKTLFPAPQEEEFGETMLAYYFLAQSPRPITKLGLSILVEDHLMDKHRVDVIGQGARIDGMAETAQHAEAQFAPFFGLFR